MKFGELLPGEKPDPCPFCGEEDFKLCVYSDYSFVQCQTCTTTGPDGNDRESALLQWNTRSTGREDAKDT